MRSRRKILRMRLMKRNQTKWMFGLMVGEE